MVRIRGHQAYAELRRLLIDRRWRPSEFESYYRRRRVFLGELLQHGFFLGGPILTCVADVLRGHSGVVLHAMLSLGPVARCCHSIARSLIATVSACRTWDSLAVIGRLGARP